MLDLEYDRVSLSITCPSCTYVAARARIKESLDVESIYVVVEVFHNLKAA